nr:tagaturonate epimerase family protein [uncultured Carboxylicivirga sp.]
MKKLSKYSFGVGDRFGHQGEAQLKAIMKVRELGYDICPVWNKSNREHTTIGTHPDDVRIEADAAVKAKGWDELYFVDADHINLDTVDRFLPSSDFFTIDVAGYIGKPATEVDIEAFLNSSSHYIGKVSIKGIDEPFDVSRDDIKKVADQYLFAAQKAGEIYQIIEGVKGKGNFITEVSMDEVPKPQTPIELFFILKMLAGQKIPVQTIAPKFSGRFNKGVDYTGNPLDFAKEFEQDLHVLDQCVQEFGLPAEIKLSVHSGSDKFSIYPHIGNIINKLDKGIHIKTAGTTWLEEVIGLSMAGGDALQFIKDLYGKALDKIDELCAPYADVIDIKTNELPSVEAIADWSADDMANAIRHIPDHPQYNPNMRQLVHVAYKLAALQSDIYLPLLKKHADIIGNCVYENIYERHLKRLFSLD